MGQRFLSPHRLLLELLLTREIPAHVGDVDTYLDSRPTNEYFKSEGAIRTEELRATSRSL